MVIGNLPDGWTIENINRVITKIPLTGRKLPQSEYLESGKYPVIDQGQSYIGGYSNDDDLVVPCKLPVIIFGDHTKAIKFVNFPFVAGADGVKVIKPSGAFSPKLFYYFLQAIELPNKGYARHFQYLEKETIPVPPLPEQERIVAKIEELFTQLDAGTAALKRVRAGLKRYKASVLKAAVSGRLINGNLEIGEGELPDGWRWTTVAELAANEPYSITDGPFGSKLKTEHYTDAGPRVIRLQNIGDGDFQDAKAHISRSHFETLKRHRIYAGDLVIAGLGESLPRACMIPDYVGDAIVKADCIRFKPNPQIADTKYLLFALNSETVKKLVAKVVHGIGRPRMNQQEIKAIPIPLPPLAEQQRIVAEVERRLSVAQEVESVVAASVARASRLRQSVLKSAFEGRLC
jgi:type I restriction enzyme S subunit